jgi:hypothetical protein
MQSRTVWKQIGPPTAYVRNAVVMPSGTIIAPMVSLPSRVIRTTDSGATWIDRRVQIGLPNAAASTLASSPQGYLFINAVGGIQRSSDEGDTWSRLPVDSGAVQPGAMIAAPNGYLYGYDGLRNLYKSTDQGAVWSKIGVSPREAPYLAVGSHGEFVISVVNRIVVYRNDTVALDLNTGLQDPVGVASTLVTAIDDSGHVYAASDPPLRTNNNNEFVPVKGITGAASAIFCDSNHMYIGMNNGRSYHSIDGGNTFVPFAQQLPDRITCFLRDSSDVILAATDGSSMFRLSLPTPAGTDSRSDNDHGNQSELQTFTVENYPNPSHESTNFKVELKALMHVQIRIQTSLGETLATVADELLPAGVYLMQWNTRGMSPGVYLYTATFNGVVQSGKLVITH